MIFHNLDEVTIQTNAYHRCAWRVTYDVHRSLGIWCEEKHVYGLKSR